MRHIPKTSISNINGKIQAGKFIQEKLSKLLLLDRGLALSGLA